MVYYIYKIYKLIMSHFFKKIVVESTTQIEFIDISEYVEDALEESGFRNGSVVIFSPHTTMSIAINHKETMLLQDFMRMLYRLVPVEDQYSHDLFELRRDTNADGRSNGHSHCKALLLGASETIPFSEKRLVLSELQTIFAVEFDGARSRDIVIQVNGN